MAATPPGPRGRPLLGSAPRFAENPVEFLQALEEAYGDISRFHMGPDDIYVVCDPTAIERILVSSADQFRKPTPRDDAIEAVLGEGLLLSEGEEWATQRDLLNPAFGMDRLGGMADRIVHHADDHTAEWTDGDVVDVEREMTRVTLDVILDLMLGVELPDDRVREVEAALEPLGERFEPQPLRIVTPSWVPLPGDREFDEAVAVLDEVVADIVAAREGTVGAVGAEGVEGAEGTEGPTDERMDLLSVLLRARDRGEQPPERLRDEVVTTLLAGHDTTALTLTYTWFLLSEHPEAAERVRAEVDEVVGDEEPGLTHVREFDYLERVIDEAMRLYPPVHTLYREPTRDVQLSGCEIPEGSVVMLPQCAVHRSERFYDEPDEFRPERWAGDRPGERPRFAYFPFGGGPRHCIGKHLAMLEAQLIVARIAEKYNLEYLGSTPLSLAPSLTAHPKQEMRMRVTERSENA